MHPQSGRPAIGRTVLAGIIVIVVIGVAAAAVLSRGPGVTSSSTASASISTSASLSTQASSSQTPTSSGGLTITNMITDVTGNFQAPSSNTTTYGNNNATTYVGSAGDVITVNVDIEYTGCRGSSCPSQVSTVNVTPDVFQVQEVDSGAGVPEPFSPTTATGENCILIVTIQAPPTNYDGPITLTLQLG